MQIKKEKWEPEVCCEESIARLGLDSQYNPIFPVANSRAKWIDGNIPAAWDGWKNEETTRKADTSGGPPQMLQRL